MPRLLAALTLFLQISLLSYAQLQCRRYPVGRACWLRDDKLCGDRLATQRLLRTEGAPPPPRMHPPRLQHAAPSSQACLHLFVTISICANLMCTATTTFVSVWGSGKALRGKDGSMDKAVDGMHAERKFIFACFGIGLITTLLTLIAAAWIIMTFEVAFVATTGIGWSIYVIVRQARRIHSKFGLSPSEAVSFNDIMASPVVPATEDSTQIENEGIRLLSPSKNARRGTYDV